MFYISQSLRHMSQKGRQWPVIYLQTRLEQKEEDEEKLQHLHLQTLEASSSCPQNLIIINSYVTDNNKGNAGKFSALLTIIQF